MQINAILGNLANERVLERLRLLAKPSSESLQREALDDAQHFMTLILEISMQRAWSMISLSETQPHNWSGLCDEDIDLARACKEKIKRDCEVISSAFEKVASKDPGCDVQARLKNGIVTSVWC